MFNIRLSNKDGLRSECKKCNSEQGNIYRKNNVEKSKERNKIYRKKNPYIKRKYYEENRENILEKERIRYIKKRSYLLAYQKDYAEKNPEKIKQRKKSYYITNKDKCLDRNRSNYIKNKDKINTLNAKWKKLNPDIVNAYNQKRRSIKKKSGGSFTKYDLKKIFISQMGKCACCDKDISSKYHIDHIKPLAKGGSNWPENIQLLSPACNLQKGTKTFRDFIEWRERKSCKK